MGSQHHSPRTLLEQIIQQRRLETSWDKLTKQVMARAAELGEDATMSTRHLQRLAAGERSGENANPGTRVVMREFFGHPLDVLLGPPTPPDAVLVDVTTDARRIAADAASASLEFASWASTDRVSPAVMEHIRYELGRIAIDYVSTPALPLLHDLVRLRDTTMQLVRDRPQPQQARELFYLTGTTCLLLAHASQNLGDSASAMAQARTALVCAEQADHHRLNAWVRGTQALIAEGSRRPAEAVEFARAGHAFATSTDAKVRLAALEARAAARIGDRAAASDALARARDARDRGSTDHDDLTQLGGILTFPLPKQLFYAGGAHSLLGEHGPAEVAARAAIELYENGPVEQRSYGDEALARVDVADARLAAGDLDGAGAALEPVVTLPTEQRIRQLHDRLGRVAAVLTPARVGRSPEARSLTEAIRSFSEQPRPSLGSHP